MITLHGHSVYLRALEPEDLDFLYAIENEEAIWEVSNTITPYSRFLIRQYLENAHQDIFEAKQLRLAICLKGQEEAVGLIDLFDFDPIHRRAGVGIIIRNEDHRGQGWGKEALSLLVNYAFTHLQLHQVFANIGEDNAASIGLFTTFGFRKIGVKKDWIFQQGKFYDEGIYQLIQNK